MAGEQTTQVQIPFGDVDSVVGETFVLEQSSRKTDPGKAYVRVHPAGTGISFFCTSGSFTPSSTGLFKRVESYETFNNSNEIQLRYPDPKNVIIELVGRFLNSDGVTVNPVLTFNSARRTVSSSIRGYGVVKVRYEAPYSLYLAIFTKSASSGSSFAMPYSQIVMVRDGLGFTAGFGTPDDEDDPAVSGYRPMTVIGKKDKEIHTLSPTPTPDSESSVTAGFGATDSKMPRLRLEIDPNYPPQLRDLTPNSAGDKLVASCRVRLYPNIAADVTTSAGWIGYLGEEKSLTVKDSVAFNGSPSSSLQYQPSGAVAVKIASGNFYDRWGRRFNPDIRLPGETFTAVTWVNSSTYGNPVSREVSDDEVIVCDSFGNSIPCYGVIELGYTTSYRTYEYKFAYDPVTKQFKTAFVGALAGGQFATVQVSPPSMRGVY